MSLIEEKSNNSNVSRYYHVENVSNISDAVEWICSVIKSKTVDPMYISLSDLVNRSDEGSGNTQLDAKATYDDIMHELDDKNIDIISVIGRFQEKPVVIGVDLRNTQCFLTARKSPLWPLGNSPIFRSLVQVIRGCTASQLLIRWSW